MCGRRKRGEMRMEKIKAVFHGASGDSFFLIIVRVVTMCLGLLITRVLSGHFSLTEYGTYSQILLLVTTVSSVTTLGMMDGINFFFCKEPSVQKRDAYVSSIFFLHFLVSTIASVTVLICTAPISKYFNNEHIKPLMIFAALLPVLQNSISLLQIMFIAIGKAKQIAIRNLLVSVFKLVAVVISCYAFDNIAVVLICQVITDVIQIVYFSIILKNNNCKINPLKYDFSLIKEILAYCIPMAMFAVIKSLNRDSDKFVISFFTNTETLAVYTNAAKLLPFDIIMTSFITVLIPYITRYIAERKYTQCQTLYKAFLELAYITTTILAVGAICVGPELFAFLYTKKYAAVDFAIPVFAIYILVDIIGVLNITLIMTASGKTRTILFASLFTLVANVVLNIGLFFMIKEIGPAVATLIVTLTQGVVILSMSAKEIKTNVLKMFDIKFLCVFFIEIVVMAALVTYLRAAIRLSNLPNLITMGLCYAVYTLPLLFINLNRVKRCLKTINSCKLEHISKKAGIVRK